MAFPTINVNKLDNEGRSAFQYAIKNEKPSRFNNFEIQGERRPVIIDTVKRLLRVQNIDLGPKSSPQVTGENSFAHLILAANSFSTLVFTTVSDALYERTKVEILKMLCEAQNLDMNALLASVSTIREALTSLGTIENKLILEEVFEEFYAGFYSDMSSAQKAMEEEIRKKWYAKNHEIMGRARKVEQELAEYKESNG